MAGKSICEGPSQRDIMYVVGAFRMLCKGLVIADLVSTSIVSFSFKRRLDHFILILHYLTLVIVLLLSAK